MLLFEIKFAVVILATAIFLYYIPGIYGIPFLLMSIWYELQTLGCFSSETLRGKSPVFVRTEIEFLVLSLIFFALAYFIPLYNIPLVYIGVTLVLRFLVSYMHKEEQQEINEIIQAISKKFQDELGQKINDSKVALASAVSRDEAETLIESAKQKMYESQQALIKQLQQEHEREKTLLIESAKSTKLDLEKIKEKHVAELQFVKSQSETKLAEAMSAMNEQLKEAQKTITALEEKVLHQQDDFIKQLEAATQSNKNRFIHNNEIHSELVQILKTASCEVDIMSPWLNEKTVDDFIISEMRRMTHERHVTLKIIYGIENSQTSSKKNKKDTRSLDLLKKLEKELHPKYFRYKYFSSHSKLVLCDELSYIITSCNVLSNRGENWEEIGEISSNQDNLRQYRDKYFYF